LKTGLASVQRAKSNPNLTSAPAIAAATSLLQAPYSQAIQPTPAPPALPYTISRTYPGHQLPVYTLTKAGGSKHLTKVRKITGDLNALKADLTKALGVEGGMTNRRGEKVEAVSVNWQNNQVIVRGWRGPEIKTWAENRGF
jgi:large subunit ribosomal protein L49